MAFDFREASERSNNQNSVSSSAESEHLLQGGGRRTRNFFKNEKGLRLCFQSLLSFISLALSCFQLSSNSLLPIARGTYLSPEAACVDQSKQEVYPYSSDHPFGRMERAILAAGGGGAAGISAHDHETVSASAGAAPLDSAQVCMSVVEHGPRIAFAAFQEETNRIILEECVADGYETQAIAQRVLADIRPTLLLVSNKIAGNEALLDVLTTPPPNPTEGLGADNENEENDDANAVPTAVEQPRTIPYRLMKTSSFELRSCKALILQLRVGSLMKQSTPASGAGGRGQVQLNQPQRHFPLAPDGGGQVFKVSSFHSLASIIDFESTVQVQAVGSLLSFLQSTHFRLEEGGTMFVNDIVRAKAASRHMTLSSETLSALHIFATEHHPLVAAKGSGNSKEGCSLFSLLDRTKSRCGRQRLREWMLKPLMDVDAIAERQDGVELFMLPDIKTPVSSILNYMDRIGAVDKILSRIQKCCAKPNDFLVLAKALSSAVAIVDVLREEVLWKLQQRLGPDTSQIPEGMELDAWQLDPQAERYLACVTKLLENCHAADLQNLFEKITELIDEVATQETKCIVIRQGQHEQLDAHKKQFALLSGKEKPATHTRTKDEVLLTHLLPHRIYPRRNS